MITISIRCNIIKLIIFNIKERCMFYANLKQQLKLNISLVFIRNILLNVEYYRRLIVSNFLFSSFNIINRLIFVNQYVFFTITN